MSYKIITLDLDGTLTNSEKKITLPTKQALIDIQKKDYKVILASGRPTSGVMPLAKELELDKYGGYILSFNGAKIINCKTNETIYQKTINPKLFSELYDYAVKYNVCVVAHDADKMYAGNSGTNGDEYAIFESKIVNLPIHFVDDFVSHIDFPVHKFLYSSHPDELNEIEATLKKKYNNFLSIYRSEPFFLEVMPYQVNKAESLMKLLSSIGYTNKEMICCGDGFNDISMIEYAGLGVAMENAQPIVKEAADYITLSNDNDGILHVINKFMLSQTDD